jgi:hypothetical protein
MHSSETPWPASPGLEQSRSRVAYHGLNQLQQIPQASFASLKTKLLHGSNLPNAISTPLRIPSVTRTLSAESTLASRARRRFDHRATLFYGRNTPDLTLSSSHDKIGRIANYTPIRGRDGSNLFLEHGSNPRHGPLTNPSQLPRDRETNTSLLQRCRVQLRSEVEEESTLGRQ